MKVAPTVIKSCSYVLQVFVPPAITNRVIKTCLCTICQNWHVEVSSSRYTLRVKCPVFKIAVGNLRLGICSKTNERKEDKKYSEFHYKRIFKGYFFCSKRLKPYKINPKQTANPRIAGTTINLPDSPAF